ncbi:3-dehydroquinate synthase [Oceanobacillus alkalisoli]|uniref:3-dehydroquinate synthase n=1 Tax=Oceanobacillus alkalisoli TaxID=2925113 RepID=UPI001F11C07E|nr:3-dehydroquinate synthase [Oceanobacillus alkalisoli]MCF3941638.1 3-dehydroquinate synthase [Oceanobacillus alkalisoli]
MQELSVQHSNGSYSIFVGNGIRFELHKYFNKSYSKIFIITDDTVEKLYLDDVRKGLSDYDFSHFIIPAGEESKHIDVYYEVQTKAIEIGLDRNALIIALGGGVVGDLAGFVAATFMRGIDYIQIPTTILAHDSSIGGKVAINHPLGKNLIGAFYPPVGVYYDMETLTSLSEREKRSGYAELIKEALISSDELFQDMLATKLASLEQEKLQTYLMAGIKVKQEIVEADEREQGVRSYLNLGHTLAHALEAELGYGNITHGEAVAIGLLFAIHVSEREYDCNLPFDKLKEWLTDNNYPLAAFTVDTEKIINHMKTDKKATKQRINMVLLKEPGKLNKEELTDETLQNHLDTFRKRLV